MGWFIPLCVLQLNWLVIMTMVTCKGVKCICNCCYLRVFFCVWAIKIFGRCMQALHRNTHNPFMQLFTYSLFFFFPPQRHKSTIRRVPTQSALLFSPATPLRPASCKSSTANWQVRGTQQPRYSTSQNIRLKHMHHTGLTSSYILEDLFNDFMA